VETNPVNACPETAPCRSRARVPIAAVWLAVSIAGVAFIYGYWSAHERPGTGVRYSAIYLTVITAVSLAGYIMYLNESACPALPTEETGWAAYWPSLCDGIIVQGVFLIFGALMLDLGQAFHISLVAAVAHWMMIILIIGRRPQSPTQLDLIAIRWGYVPLLIVIGRIGPLIWIRLGRW